MSLCIWGVRWDRRQGRLQGMVGGELSSLLFHSGCRARTCCVHRFLAHVVPWAGPFWIRHRWRQASGDGSGLVGRSQEDKAYAYLASVSPLPEAEFGVTWLYLWAPGLWAELSCGHGQVRAQPHRGDLGEKPSQGCRQSVLGVLKKTDLPLAPLFSEFASFSLLVLQDLRAPAVASHGHCRGSESQAERPPSAGHFSGFPGHKSGTTFPTIPEPGHSANSCFQN